MIKLNFKNIRSHKLGNPWVNSIIFSVILGLSLWVSFTLGYLAINQLKVGEGKIALLLFNLGLLRVDLEIVKIIFSEIRLVRT